MYFKRKPTGERLFGRLVLFSASFLKSIVRILGYSLLLFRFNNLTNIIFISLLLVAELIWFLFEYRNKKLGVNMKMTFHKAVSFLKSAIRVVGCGLVLGGYSYLIGFGFMLGAELLGFVEELHE